MNRYVKITGHSNWFLCVEPNTASNKLDDLNEVMAERMKRKIFDGIHSSREYEKQTVQEKLLFHCTNEIDYKSLANKYNKTIVVRPYGSFMYLPTNPNEIIEERLDYDFPKNQFADIVICENDEKPYYEWVQYLKKRFPNKSIETLNFFDNTKEEKIIECFKNAEYVTFYTTFTDLEWFKKMVHCLHPNNKVIGYCTDTAMWDVVLKIYNKMEVVEGRLHDFIYPKSKTF